MTNDIEKIDKQIEKNDRMELAGKFISALLKDFKKNGKQAIEDVRKKSPSKYLDLVAGAIPKEAKEQKHLHLSLIKTMKELGQHGLDEEIVDVVSRSGDVREGSFGSKEDGAVSKAGSQGNNHT